MVTKQEIEQLVIKQKESNLKNHFHTAWNRDSTTYTGEIKKNVILLWKSSSFMRSIYPIFTLNFDDNGILKNIVIHQNPLHKYFNLFLIVVLISVLTSQFILFDISQALLQIAVILVMSLLLYFLLRKINNFEKENLIDELKHVIKQIEKTKGSNEEISENVLEKEWTLSKILTRLVLYPFCLFIIYISITEFIPCGKLNRAILGISIPLVYITTDLKILLSNKTSANTRHKKTRTNR